MRSPPCGSNSVFEVAHTVYKYAPNQFSFRVWVSPPNLKHQADNLAKLRQEFLSVIELIAKIFGAVSRTISLMRLSALLASYAVAAMTAFVHY